MHLYIGILGSLLCVIALAITLFKSNFGESNNYKLLNFIGGSCLFYYAFAIKSPPFILLEGTWALLPLIALISKKLKS
ncbi:MAG: hypothetical protein KGQ36_05210 [Rickettsiales bacterium]|nr:hypothetical protein [Rickettsiales bacterium]